MVQYFSNIKQKVDAISVAESSIDAKDIILYTLASLPSTYQSFKTTIRTKMHPISLDDFCALLCSEELNLASEIAQENSPTVIDMSFTLAAIRGRSRGRGNPLALVRGRPPSPFSISQGGHSPVPFNRGGRRSCPVACKLKYSFGLLANSSISYQSPTALVTAASSSASTSSVDLWHHRLRHPATSTQ
ncbi:hypothetical protein M5K25_022997 [Dendrobium thyrsiflorum]|uniref:Retrovirus-related Pol polyprotein from transposon TNT 1-94 n=1 Tax=Dendrobium thyrsiflorum TaxID=117978 RepID=A0ABD0U749_DENTH